MKTELSCKDQTNIKMHSQDEVPRRGNVIYCSQSSAEQFANSSSDASNERNVARRVLSGRVIPGKKNMNYMLIK